MEQHHDHSVVVQDKGFIRVKSAVYYILGILGVVEVLLVFRFLFKLLAANPLSGFVAMIYAITDALLTPFTGIFRVASARTDGMQAILEPATLVGIAVYAVIAWGIIKLIQVYRINKH